MASKSNLIREYCKANGVSNVDFMKDLLLVDEMVDGVSNPYIKEWNLDIAQPTDEQLDSYNDDATTLENNTVIRSTRRTAYGDIGDQLDEIFKDTNAWKTRIQQIKDDNPKS